MTVYDYATEPDQAKQLQQAWQEGYESACSDMTDFLQERMDDAAKLTRRTRATRARRYFEGWHDAMLELWLQVAEMDGDKGESCEQG
jgi:hypothetical protein